MSTKRVLVVDDNHDSAQMLVIMLELAGCEARAAGDGASALALLTEFRPDLALLDINLPDMDGYELARKVRALPGLEGVRLAAITGFSDDSDRRRAREAGFHHFLVKPFEPEAVERLLRP